jgi:2'-5' RNA ligase
MPEHRVFFALQPDAPAAERIARLTADLRKRLSLSGKPVAGPRLHLSLNFVGGFRGPPPRAAIDKANQAVAEVVVRPFAVALNRVESWKGDPHPLVLAGEDEVIGVEGLHTTLHKALRAVEMAPRREPEVSPHMTLLWDRREVPAECVEPITWTVREFVLIDSVFGEGRHEVLGRWPLHG